MLGPSTSGAVAASTKTYYAAKLAHISPSATRTTLTKTVGGTFEGTPAFFRDVPGDYIQGPSDANFMINSLHVKKVVIMDFQEPYSLGLAGASTRRSKAKGVSTIPSLGAEHDDRLLGVRDEGARATPTSSSSRRRSRATRRRSPSS